jgi:hypothetical protein
VAINTETGKIKCVELLTMATMLNSSIVTPVNVTDLFFTDIINAIVVAITSNINPIDLEAISGLGVKKCNFNRI